MSQLERVRVGPGLSVYREYRNWLIDCQRPGGERQRMSSGTDDRLTAIERAINYYLHPSLAAAEIPGFEIQKAGANPLEEALESHEFVRRVEATVSRVLDNRDRAARPALVSITRAIDGYVDYQTEVKRNVARHVAAVKSHLNDFQKIAKVQHIQDIGRQHVELFVASMKLDPKTVKNHAGSVSGFLEWCVAQKWISENPAEGVVLPKVPSKAVRYHDADEWKRISAAARGTPYERLIWMAMFTGIPRGDLLKQTVDRIDLKKQFIHSEVRNKNGKLRSIPIFDQLLPVLKDLPKSGRLFPWSPRAGFLSRAIAKIFKAAGVADGGLQSLRRSYCTNCRLNGVSAYTVSRWAAHNSRVDEQFYSGYSIQGRAVPLTWKGKPLVSDGIQQ